MRLRAQISSAINSQNMSFSGTAGETQSVTLATTEDQVYEGDERLWIILSNSSNASVDVSDNAPVTITDDDSAGLYALEDDGLGSGNRNHRYLHRCTEQ